MANFNPPVKGSSKKNPEYEKARDNMEMFIKAIAVIPEALTKLTIKFMSARWLEPNFQVNDRPNKIAKVLFTQVLNRIENDSSQYEVFMTMLKDIDGTDQIVRNLTVTPESVSGKQRPTTPRQKRACKPKEVPVPSELDSGISDIQPDAQSCSMPHELDNASCIQHPKLDTVEHTFPPGPARKPNTEAEGIITPIMETAKGQKVAAAAIYLSEEMVARLAERDKQAEQIQKLEQKLKEESDAKDALRQEKEELTVQLKRLQENAKEKEEAAKKIIEEKEKELVECKQIVSKVEKEKSEMESLCKEKVEKLEAQIECLRAERENEKKEDELKTLRLENKLIKAEKELAEKMNVITKQEKDISLLKVIVAKDAEIHKLKSTVTDKDAELQNKDAEIHKLRQKKRDCGRGRGLSLSRSLSNLRVEGTAALTARSGGKPGRLPVSRSNGGLPE